MWTKRQLIQQALSELGMADYAFDLQPEQLQAALRQLDAMMGAWNIRGIRIGYSGGDGLGDIDNETDLPDWAIEGIYCNLAVKIAPSYGKTPSPETKAAATAGLNTILIQVAQPRVRALTGYAGAGSWDTNILQEPDPLDTGNDNILEFGRAG